MCLSTPKWSPRKRILLRSHRCPGETFPVSWETPVVSVNLVENHETGRKKVGKKKKKDKKKNLMVHVIHINSPTRVFIILEWAIWIASKSESVSLCLNLPLSLSALPASQEVQKTRLSVEAQTQWITCAGRPVVRHDAGSVRRNVPLQQLCVTERLSSQGLSSISIQESDVREVLEAKD